MHSPIVQRWESYRRANFQHPGARENEFQKMFELVNPEPGQKILEVGTGNGFHTFPIADALGSQGEVATADVTQGNIDAVRKANEERGLNITTFRFRENDEKPFSSRYENYFDTVASIATLHHFDNRAKTTGTSGRRSAISEFHRVLKPGGTLVLADPMHGTITQRYFDRIDDPKYCHPDGHPHDFFTREQLHDAVSRSGFVDVKIQVLSMPWRFDSEAAAQNFVNTIHNAQCSSRESFEIAREILGFQKVDNHYELGWELFFLTARQ